MTPHDYTYLQGFLKKKSGLVLNNKEYLVQSRLEPVAKKLGLVGISGLVEKLKSGQSQIESDVVEAMTTNETTFFRDKTPFDLFRDTIIPRIVKTQTRKSMRIWCVAGSTGQEPYSLAMCLKEAGNALAGWQTEIIATDISKDAIAKSEAGLYSQFEVQRGLPINLLMKYFSKKGESWQINADLRSMVKHRQLNLLADFNHLGKFDIIFCRNILIYFDEAAKKATYQRLAGAIQKDGVLVLGAAETMLGLTTSFTPCADLKGFFRPVSL